MKTHTTMQGDTETSGTKFFTWAILVVAAGLLVAVTTDFTSARNMTTTAHATHAVHHTEVASADHS